MHRGIHMIFTLRIEYELESRERIADVVSFVAVRAQTINEDQQMTEFSR
jgi:hypothetical protein